MGLKHLIKLLVFTVLFLIFVVGRSESSTAENNEPDKMYPNGTTMSLQQKVPRNLQNSPFGANQNGGPAPSYCGQVLGTHLMIGSYNFCGGFNPNDCSAVCYNQNFTYFQCESSICHCFS